MFSIFTIVVGVGLSARGLIAGLCHGVPAARGTRDIMLSIYLWLNVLDKKHYLGKNQKDFSDHFEKADTKTSLAYYIRPSSISVSVDNLKTHSWQNLKANWKDGYAEVYLWKGRQ